MKHKADIGRCTIAKHTAEVEPGVVRKTGSYASAATSAR